MLNFLRDLIQSIQAQIKFLNLTDGAMTRHILLCEVPCARPLAIRPDSLPSLTYQAGHHEKNVNQCNSNASMI
jgi:hypothetical protein